MKNDLAEAQLQTLQERLQDHHWEAMLLLALVLGLRRDELRHLTWSKVDLETGEMVVLNKKTKGHIRFIHVPEDLLHVLQQHALRQEQQNRETDTVQPHSDLVFSDSTGGELSIQRFSQAWYACREDVGVPRLRFHDLRVLVWRRLLLQKREGRDGCVDDRNTHSSREEPHYGQA